LSFTFTDWPLRPSRKGIGLRKKFTDFLSDLIVVSVVHDSVDL
jgi:hypothetical protein